MLELFALTFAVGLIVQGQWEYSYRHHALVGFIMGICGIACATFILIGAH